MFKKKKNPEAPVHRCSTKQVLKIFCKIHRKRPLHNKSAAFSPATYLFLKSLFVSWANLFCWTQFPEFYNYLFEGAKILLWYCLCWIFGLLHFLKQWRFCSDIHLQQALRSVFNNITYIVKCKLHCRCLKVHSQVWYNCWQLKAF